MLLVAIILLGYKRVEWKAGVSQETTECGELLIYGLFYTTNNLRYWYGLLLISQRLTNRHISPRLVEL